MFGKHGKPVAQAGDQERVLPTHTEYQCGARQGGWPVEDHHQGNEMTCCSLQGLGGVQHQWKDYTHFSLFLSLFPAVFFFGQKFPV